MPTIYFYDVNNNTLRNADTTLLLYTKYVDPGVYAEDNVSKSSAIIISSNLEDELPVTSAGYNKRTGQYVIRYTATDEAGNVGEKLKNITVYNVSEPFANSYITTRNTLYLNNDTSYSSTVSADRRIPGRLRFSKVYSHYLGDKRIYFKVNADLYAPDKFSTSYSEEIGYMGTQSDKDTPFFSSMTYDAAADSILTVTHLKVFAQEYSDTTGNYSVAISGVEEGGVPLSRIEYLSNSKTIYRIILELNVTDNGVVDRVTEIYTPKEF